MSYTVYNKNSFAVMIPREPHETQLKKIGARWYKSLRTGEPGWLVPRNKEDVLKSILGLDEPPVLDLEGSEQPPSEQPQPPSEQPTPDRTPPKRRRLNEIQQHARPRHEQNRYHRSVSASRKEKRPESPPLEPPPEVEPYTRYRKTPPPIHEHDTRDDDNRIRPRSKNYRYASNSKSRDRHTRDERPRRRRDYSPEYEPRRNDRYYDRSPSPYTRGRSVREEMRELQERMDRLQRRL